MTLPAAAARLPADIDRYLMPTLRRQQAADADQRDRQTDTHPLHRLCTAYYRPTIYCRPVGRKWNGGCFSCKKVDLSSTQGALCTVSIYFYFTFYLFTHPMHPPACGPVLYKSTVIYTVWQLFNELKHKASQHVFIYCWNWCGLSAEMHRSSTLLKQWLKCLTVDRIRLHDQSARGPNRHTAFTYWLSCGFTSKSTQNGSFRRRFPKPISWPGMEKTKSNTTKARIHQSKEMYYNTK